MKLHLDHKIVLLTGGTGGLGSHISLDFLKEQAIVILLYRNEKKFNKLSDWLAAQVPIDGRLFGIQASITDNQSIQQAVRQVIKAHDRIDVLVNCAGYAMEAPFSLLEEEDIEQMIDVNYKAPLYLSKAVLRYMLRQKAGSIINITSVSTHAAGRGITVYASAKAGLERLTQVLALEFGKKNIRINAVCPGVIDTDMSKNLRSVAEKYILEGTALKRYGQSQEVSKAVLFLASEETASFITGQTINVDGGFYL